MARNKPKEQRTVKKFPARTTDANGLDSIFWNLRNPTHAELGAYHAYMGTLENNRNFVPMLGTAFLTQADAMAYWQYIHRLQGSWTQPGTPDP